MCRIRSRTESDLSFQRLCDILAEHIPFAEQPISLPQQQRQNMNNPYHQEMFYDQGGSRSPGSQRHQPQAVHRQSSRQFDAYGQMPNSLFNPDDQPQRFETNRFDRMNTGMAGGGFGAYDMGGAQTWNPNAFGGSPAFGAFGASRTMKPTTRGRSNLPPVSFCQGV